MIDLQVFNRRSRCPKCLGVMVDLAFVPDSPCDVACQAGIKVMNSDGDRVGHLHVTCRDCGFTWSMQTAEESGVHE